MATIFVDFDGTITEHDLLDEIARTFGDPEVYAEVDARLDAGDITLHEVLRREFEPVRASLDEVVAWVLGRVRVRAGFRELVDWSAERGARLVVLSSGFRELIAPVLEREGLGVELVANEVDADPGGWRIRFRDETPCSVCGEPCKRAAVVAIGNGDRRIYVGDGFSDRCGALASDVVFARRGLAHYLTEEGVPHRSFSDFHEVIEGLEHDG